MKEQGDRRREPQAKVEELPLGVQRRQTQFGHPSRAGSLPMFAEKDRYPKTQAQRVDHISQETDG